MPNGPLYEAFGEAKNLAGWSRDPRCTVRMATLRNRIHSGKWELEAAITTPADPHGGPKAGAARVRAQGDVLRERIRQLVQDGAPTLASLADTLSTTPQSAQYHIAQMPDSDVIKAKMVENRRALRLTRDDEEGPCR